MKLELPSTPHASAWRQPRRWGRSCGGIPLPKFFGLTHPDSLQFNLGVAQHYRVLCGGGVPGGLSGDWPILARLATCRGGGGCILLFNECLLGLFSERWCLDSSTLCFCTTLLLFFVLFMLYTDIIHLFCHVHQVNKHCEEQTRLRWDAVNGLVHMGDGSRKQAWFIVTSKCHR